MSCSGSRSVMNHAGVTHRGTGFAFMSHLPHPVIMHSLSAWHSSWHIVPHLPGFGDTVMQFVQVLVPVQQPWLSVHDLPHTPAGVGGTGAGGGVGTGGVGGVGGVGAPPPVMVATSVELLSHRMVPVSVAPGLGGQIPSGPAHLHPDAWQEKMTGFV